MREKSRTRINPSPEALISFRNDVCRFFEKHGRRLPWRTAWKPYHIVVSEIMLQQTQVERVIAKFEAFIASFPDFHSLDTASMREVLLLWKGLGYNRRAYALKEIARRVCRDYNGVLPCDRESLLRLPSIGRATAASILAFAFDRPEVVIETNIRTVYIYHFLRDQTRVSDDDIESLIRATMDREHPRTWYSALMDYGSHLKKLYPELTGKSSAYKKQSRFDGSDRQIRGKILGIVAGAGYASEGKLIEEIEADAERIRDIAGVLVREGLVVKKGNRYEIP
ncbi:MAG: A/G-specific adenine glycosylase [Spirochaetales bacterium]|nr:A/G-specific adenine glycosylase [Spirochaetales bacterium]